MSNDKQYIDYQRSITQSQGIRELSEVKVSRALGLEEQQMNIERVVVKFDLKGISNFKVHQKIVWKN
ncbi:hypothetical protein GNP81_05335 [Aliivibrio fischeri]|uniref:hypothetical protein n=1 Tax=Aliivibrio fischeri TaxID=668 RepID=UPI0012D8A0F6|nr:hypothetical protein [Aliivibrio fischeri]MUK63130.1 hypothetical protein [Aliivibrio fischeri]MUL20253.1 hypothetical protein [Aliivibrio fischeri]MUL24028.1 hypothetical protein [Aliivibrio fischeri]